jgi:hypothetical protein
MAINYLPSRNIYPTSGRQSLGQVATGFDPGPNPETLATGGGGEVEAALTVGGQATPLVGFGVFLILVVATMFLAQKAGAGDGQFANIKATAYNAVIVGWLAILTIPLWKFLFTKLKVPGVSTWVHSV